jgi:hypothetical protein
MFGVGAFEVYFHYTILVTPHSNPRLTSTQYGHVDLTGSAIRQTIVHVPFCGSGLLSVSQIEFYYFRLAISRVPDSIQLYVI